MMKKRKKKTINNILRSCQKLQGEEKEILPPMPGYIQVSVLGLMDLSLSPPLGSLSLTVSMGKREYRTVGSGELSLPVVSLREDLTVMVHNAEGEEILRTEFKTMILLERGLWDNLIPLKNGGSLHMKLQFLLSEEDRKRIREMRDSALKRRCMEKPRTRHRRSFSDNRVGCSPARSIADPQQKDRDAYVQGNESMVLPSPRNACIENSPSSLESNGGLIEQGVWIVVIIVACGLLLKGV